MSRPDYPRNPPEYDVIAAPDDELDEALTATMVASKDRTNYIRAGQHGFHIDEPVEMDHSFKDGIGGKHEAPTALDYLQAAAMGCQVNSLELLLHKSRVEGYEISAESTPYLYKEGDLRRVQKLAIEITLEVPEEYEDRAERCLELYEKGCLVGESIKRGIEMEVTKTLRTRPEAAA